MRTQKRTRCFVTVLPALSASCLLHYLPISYSEREVEGDKCIVTEFNNPPRRTEVSCTAPIEPPAKREEWCTVESAEDPTKKVNVKCPRKKR